MELKDCSMAELKAEIRRREIEAIPKYHCSQCQTPEEESGFGMLVDITVITADGEEGFAKVMQLLCDTCLEPKLEALKELGFMDHRHGGINYLENDSCEPNAYETCLTPSEYGRYIVQ